MAAMTSPDTDDLPRQMAEMMRFGTVEAVTGSRASVRIGDIVSPPLPWFSLAGLFSLWCPPSAGEQVLVLCPESDLGHGVILRGLYSDANPPPADGVRLQLDMPGATIAYDPDTGELAIDLTSGFVTISAPDGVAITGDLTVDGKISASGDIQSDHALKASGDLTVLGNTHLGTGAVLAVKLSDNSNALTVKAT